jgi:hypothetical protein
LNAYAYWKENAPAEAPEFFNAFFKKLAGSNELQQALESGMSVGGVGEVLSKESVYYEHIAKRHTNTLFILSTMGRKSQGGYIRHR